MKNRIYLERKNKLILERGTGEIHRRYIATIMKNIENFGFVLAEDVVEVLETYNMKELMDFYVFLIRELSRMVGAHRAYKPMYPNFPAQVMEAHEAELYLNAVIHYLTRELPQYKKKKREKFVEDVKMKVIELGDEEDFQNIFKDIIKSKIAVSLEDRMDLSKYIDIYVHRGGDMLPEEIPNKENLAYVVSTIYSRTGELGTMDRYFKIPQDILRFAVALSDGDMSLAEPTRFKKFKRSHRRMFLQLLENCGNLHEDMNRHRERWIRLGEILHPGEYRSRYPKCYDAFTSLREKSELDSFNSRVEKLLITGRRRDLLDLLEKRPGEYARRLDKLLRDGEETELVLEKFKGIAHKVASPIILQMYNHFLIRNRKSDLRVFFPKGQTAKAYALENNLKDLDENVRIRVVEICRETLIDNYKIRGALGKVYVDKKLEKYTVPFSQRSASKALKTIPRGSRVELSEKNFIRFFLWWREGFATSRVDIDLSISIFDENWGHLEDVAYYNLKGSKFKAYHSGDITCAPEGASEFIDVDRESILKNGGRFIICTVTSFTNQKYCDLPECFCGWMERAGMNSGEIYEPSTVVDKFDLTGDTQISIPVIVDVLKGEVVWSDMALTSNPRYYINVPGNKNGVFLTGKALTELQKPNLYQLFTLHGMARGTIVDSPCDADHIYSTDEGTTPYDIPEIIGNYI